MTVPHRFSRFLQNLVAKGPTSWVRGMAMLLAAAVVWSPPTCSGQKLALPADIGKAKSVAVLVRIDGSNVIMMVLPVPSDAAGANHSEEFKRGMQYGISAQAPGITFVDESTRLWDPTHTFVAFRAQIPFRQIFIAQSYQGILINGSVATFVFTTASPNTLSQLITNMKSYITFTQPKVPR